MHSSLSGIRSRARLMVLFGVACVAWSCSSLTEVDATDIVETSDLESATGATALRGGALGGFSGVFLTGSFSRSQISASGRLSDEFFGNAASDQRILPEPEVEIQYPYAQMHAARVNLSLAIRAVQSFTPNPRSLAGELFALRSFIEIFFGENVCSGIPLGDVRDGRAIPGQPLSTQEMFEHALTTADSALAYSVDSARVLNLTRVARGRALLNLGRFAEGAAAVAQVPTGSLYRVFPATNAFQTNSIASQINSRAMSVSDNEGVNGLNFRSANDPRVPTQAVGPLVGRSSITVFRFIPYTTTTAPVTLASGIEARLIEAEAALQAGDATTWLVRLNSLRASVITPAMAALADPGTAAARVDLMFRERAFWLFGTGHRHGDLRRMIRSVNEGGYGRSSSSTSLANAETVFPTGPYYTLTSSYGNSVTFPADSRQYNNSAYTGCQRRAP